MHAGGAAGCSVPFTPSYHAGSRWDLVGEQGMQWEWSTPAGWGRRFLRRSTAPSAPGAVERQRESSHLCQQLAPAPRATPPTPTPTPHTTSSTCFTSAGHSQSRPGAAPPLPGNGGGGVCVHTLPSILLSPASAGPKAKDGPAQQPTDQGPSTLHRPPPISTALHSHFLCSNRWVEMCMALGCPPYATDTSAHLL